MGIKKKILLIDNNDSFTYNLVQAFEENGAEVVVIPVRESPNCNVFKFDGIVLSPGPGLPYEYPEMNVIIDNCFRNIPLLGVCLGFQTIAIHFGAEIYRLDKIRHGISSTLKYSLGTLYDNISSQVNVGRYHSWAIRKLPEDFTVTAISDDDVIMSYSSKDNLINAVQYHPESIITEFGYWILGNWLKSF
ncbi:MAG: aminodeoxychorismate/anthranilate synthase component II [Candidatus Kapabacteria bacterium]|nr:aminodeoxychorismate/anthranilate synthase component II [Ignavibacteriota bacterium]MCW5885136.1 aminodeoxychorismate/anthranilate synthase component II [Candidatus Kapabacteria bacterium]